MSRIEDKGEMYDVHFVALFSKKSDAIPVISLHGWPGKVLKISYKNESHIKARELS